MGSYLGQYTEYPAFSSLLRRATPDTDQELNSL